MKNLEGIVTNFRVKKVFAQSNMLESIEGLRRYKFLDTLFVSNNRLRNLDKFLTFLSSKFAFLEELDLFGNPLAEEPDYRLKIIHTMPQIKLLDRHTVTIEERIKAAKMFETPTTTKRSHTATKGVSGSFSKGEKDLYKEVATLRKLDEERKVRLEQERLNFYKQRTYVGIPVPTKKAENKDKFGVGNREDRLDEWEKNQVKRLFRAEFDKDKAGIASREEIRRLLTKLANDECVIGKVPNASEEDLNRLAEGWELSKDTGKVSWFEFRDQLNSKLLWRLQDRDRLEETVEGFFKQAYKYRMQGNEKDSKEYAARALRLQGALTKTKPIEIVVKKEDPVPKRGDYFQLKIFRRAADDILDPSKTTMSKYKEPMFDKSASFKLAPGAPLVVKSAILI